MAVRQGVPREVSEAIFSWLDAVPPERTTVLAAQTAGWQEVELRAARWTMLVHGIAPLLYTRLHDTPAWSSIPQPLQSYLVDQYGLNRERNALLMQELRAILQSANDCDLQVMPLKGCALVYHYYDDPALRPMADLDLLVKRADLQRVDRLLAGLGYEPTLAQTTARHMSYFLTRFGRKAVSTQGEHPQNPHLLDLHLRVREVIRGMRYDVTEELWAEPQSALYGDVHALLPQPHALLQHLLIHSSADMVGVKLRLIRLYDIMMVARRLSAEGWQKLLRTARRQGEERLLYAPLVLADRYFDCRVPESVWAELRRQSPAELVAFLMQADAYLLSFCNPMALAPRQKLSWYRPGRERLLAVRHRVLPPLEDLKLIYPDHHTDRSIPVTYLAHMWNAITEQMFPLLRRPRRLWRAAFRQIGLRNGSKR